MEEVVFEYFFVMGR